MKQAMIDYMQKPKNDSFETPYYAVKPLLEYINPNWTIWEPTDTTGESQITRALKDHGCKVVSTNKTKFDFLTDTPDFYFDCIVTNPPYSIKDDFISKCYSYTFTGIEVRWALLLPITALEGVKRGVIFRNEPNFGVMVFDRRIEYMDKSAYFNTSWFCYGILPRQLIFKELNK